MKLSMNWLRDYADVNVSPKAFADAMTMSGSKVEEWTVLGEDIQNVVIGKILSVERHPDADRLSVCAVDVGDKTLQIVTGATNIAAGDMVPVATDGATLPGGVKIKKGKLRGVVSEGMLCSLGELGLTQADFPYAVEDGIFVVREDCRIGADVREALGLTDTVVEFEITSNRPDCLSVLGLAREAAATFRLPFSPKAPTVTECGGNIADYVRVSVEAPDLCPRYMARVVKNVKIGPSPRFVRERLRACGIRPINNLVDITNYVMLEYGQPMHAFDLSLLQGGHIRVRRAREGESIVTLDGIERKPAPSALVIADEVKPVAVAGVMGGEFSGIREDTVTVVLESANFDGTSVRLTARDLGLRTDSSARFEKGPDPENCAAALDRACELITLFGCGEIVSGVIDVRVPPKAPKKIPFDPAGINRFLGIELDRDEMVRILTALDFAVEGDAVIPPSFRADIEEKADVAEEIARFYGYDRIPAVPLAGSAQSIATRELKFANLLHDVCVGLGFWQIHTYSFYSAKHYDKIGLPEDSPRRRSVKIANPLGEDTSLMRTTALPSLLEVLGRNRSNRLDEAALYELATVYLPADEPDLLPDERQKLMLGLYGPAEDFYALKGCVETVLKAADVTGAEFVADGARPEFHPGRCAEIRLGDEVLGVLGQIRPDVGENFELDLPVFVAELDVAALLRHSRGGEKLYRPLPKFPATTRDLALICDDEMPAGVPEKIIRAAGGKLLESVRLFDVYRGKPVPEGKKSLAFTLAFRAADRTLTDSETDAVMNKIVGKLTDSGILLRS